MVNTSFFAKTLHRQWTQWNCGETPFNYLIFHSFSNQNLSYIYKNETYPSLHSIDTR
jgi:hypothetical protein